MVATTGHRRWRTPRRVGRTLCSVSLMGCLTGLLDPPPASADRARPFPILIRVEGFVGAKPEGGKSLGRWGVAVGGAQYTFHITKLVPIGVDIAYWNILNQLEPLPVTLTLYSNPQLLDAFTTAPAGVPIAVTGNFEFGPGPVTLMAASVELLPPSTPEATSTAASATMTPGSAESD